MARTNKDTTRRLVPLKDLSDYKIADDDPDIRGWDVVTADRLRIGEVHELIVEPSAMRVRYLDVELDKEFRAGRDDRHVLIPIEKARLNEDKDDVLVDRITSDELQALPDFQHQDVSPDYEDSVWRSFGAESGRARSGTSVDDSRFFGGRRRGREHAPYFTQRSDRELSRPIVTEPPPSRGAEPSAAEPPPAQRGEAEPPPSRR